MFTGIVTHRGRMVRAEATEGGGRRFVLHPEPDIEGTALGASFAVDGVCLTVSAVEADGFAFDVVPETLRKTTLGECRAGDLVNLEPSLHLGDEMGGHMVQGHVEGVATVLDVERQGEDVRLTLQVGEDLVGAAIPKGSVAIDGVSLTVGEMWKREAEGDEGADGARECFSVYLVPYTLDVTGLGAVAPGDRVNVEPDVLGRWVEHHVRRLLSGADGKADGKAGGEAS